MTSIRRNDSHPSPPTARVVGVVDFLALRPGETFTATEIAKALGINRSTCLAILRTLVDLDWVKIDRHHHYALGPALIAVGESARGSLRLLDEARVEMEPLALRLGLETMAAIPAGDRLIVAITAGGDDFHHIMRVGQALPISPPFAMVAVAFSSEENIEAWLDRAPTPLTRSERDYYREAIAAVRARGYSATLDIETRRRLGEALAELARHPTSIEARERRDALVAALAHDRYVISELPRAPALPISQVSAPVFDADGRVALVLGVQGFPHQVALDQFAKITELIVGAAARITVRIGGRRPDLVAPDLRSASRARG
jgi:DNA-binding IclR family transcriptional regulator